VSANIEVTCSFQMSWKPFFIL